MKSRIVAILLSVAVAAVSLTLFGCGNRDKKTGSVSTGGSNAARSVEAGSQGKRPRPKISPELEAFLKSAGTAPEATGESDANSKDTADVPGPKAAVQTGQPPARPTPEQLLNAVRMFYGGIESVRCEGVSTTVVRHDGKVAAEVKNTPFTVLFKRPDRIKMTGPDSELISDGKTVYTYLPKAKRFSKQKADDDLLRALVMSKAGVGLIGLLLRADYEKAVESAKLLADARIRGNETFVLELQLKAPRGSRASQKLWIGKKDLIIYKNEVITRDRPERPQGYTGPIPRMVETTTVGTLTRFDANPRLPDSAFVFKPPAGAKPIETAKPVDVMNKPAPDFSFRWIDGTEKKLSDFRGKTVLLNFWALPDCEAQLPVLQSIERELKEVQLIAVNLNSDAAKVDEFLRKKNFDFLYVHGSEAIAMTALERYGLTAIPTMFIIDSEGVVRGGMIGVASLQDIREKLRKSLPAETGD